MDLITILDVILVILFIAMLILIYDAGLLKNLYLTFVIAILIVGTIGGFALIRFVLL